MTFRAIPSGIPFFSADSNPACAAKAIAVDGGAMNGPTTSDAAIIRLLRQKVAP